MKDLLKKSDLIVNIVRKVRGWFGYDSKKLSQTFYQRNRTQLINTYFNHNAVRKLQIGCQGKILSGWLNVDLEPKSAEVVLMDATKPFPFPSQSFDYIFTEHMIEHITREEAEFMLQECYRVLTPGGKIRIVTPDLNAVVKVFLAPDVPSHQEYLAHYRKQFLDPHLPNDPVYVMNMMFYGFGHRFIYTESSLRWVLDKTKFHDMKVMQVGVSDDPVLQHLEKHGIDLGEANNKLESIVIQAIK